MPALASSSSAAEVGVAHRHGRRLCPEHGRLHALELDLNVFGQPAQHRGVIVRPVRKGGNSLSELSELSEALISLVFFGYGRTSEEVRSRSVDFIAGFPCVGRFGRLGRLSHPVSGSTSFRMILIRRVRRF